MVILVDDEDRENEGDFVVAAEHVTPEHVAFMARHGRGLTCLALQHTRIDALGLSPMVERNASPLGTAFTVSVDLRHSGGIGAAARARTMRALADPAVPMSDFAVPGHVFPLRARQGGVLVRAGQTEGSVDLARLAGCTPAGVICEVMGEDGAMLRLPSLLAFGEQHDIPVATVADIIRYRLSHETLVRCVAESKLPTDHGTFDVRCYESVISGRVHVALTLGVVNGDDATLVRVHRADTVADVLGLGVLPTGSRIDWALARLAAEGSGVLLYLRPERQARPLDESVRYYGAVGRGEPAPAAPTPPMGFHGHGIGAQILADLGVTTCRVIANRPIQFKGLSGHGIDIIGRVPMEGPADGNG